MWRVYAKYWRLSDQRGQDLYNSGLRAWVSEPDFIGDREAGQPREYDPLSHPQLVSQVAALEEEDEPALLQFIHRWGTLDNPLVGYRSTFTRVAREVRNILELHGQLQRGNTRALDQMLDVLGYKDYADDPVLSARFCIAQSLNHHLWSISQSFDLRALPDQLRLRAQPKNLEDAIYWHLARVVADGRPVEYCLECHKPFVVTDARQRFCPPRKGRRYSTCYERWRKRRKRNQQRLKRQRQKGG